MRWPEIRLHPQLPAITGAVRHRAAMLLIIYRRRLIAATLLLTAATIGNSLVLGPPGERVIAAGSAVAPGAVISDTREVWLPKSALWDGVLRTAEEVIGQRAAHALSPGQPITASDLVGPGLTSGLAANQQAVPIQIAADLATLLRTGQHVDAFARNQLGQRARAASDAVVLSILPTTSSSMFASGGNTLTVLLATDSFGAAALAGAESVTVTLRAD